MQGCQKIIRGTATNRGTRNLKIFLDMLNFDQTWYAVIRPKYLINIIWTYAAFTITTHVNL
ncbi:hypothetical protein B932_3389 [Gluconobacter oxydans H24]|nr:hypothetical protein B932_3389 [Gluconobacter oxydans H24]